MTTPVLKNPVELKKRRVFVLDQDTIMAEALAKGLRLYGFAAFASTLPEEILKNIEPDDILLADYHLPDSNGLEVAQQAYARGWRGPLLLLYGRAGALKKDLIHPLLISILEKPYSTQVLLEKLQAVAKTTPLL